MWSLCFSSGTPFCLSRVILFLDSVSHSLHHLCTSTILWALLPCYSSWDKGQILPNRKTPYFHHLLFVIKSWLKFILFRWSQNKEKQKEQSTLKLHIIARYFSMSEASLQYGINVLIYIHWGPSLKKKKKLNMPIRKWWSHKKIFSAVY